ncbi:mitochondrial carrier protein LEU5 [Aspergillus terreus NIH2624]|uniref:Mitochondrial thiamine pyrophosphate carrier 1 n=1 Tax=Aspergillus terreus (strain NIH 2624 / FGSC A1156) TaxID=341663 RepID=Q0C8D2_ASPTN|nr:mitochondrial carrier protein LEU5 [Aspergillus terreus NIH2624]EAU29501.1 mitochondrial carrier protein LEU5 [Aspergillus terreus NIH2624]
MSLATPGHAHADSSFFVAESHQKPTIAEPGTHMEQVTQSRSGRGSTTGDAPNHPAVATAQATAVASESSLQSTSSPRGGTKETNKRSVDYVLRSGLAGGLAGCAAKTVVAPLDRVKILFQASNPQFAKYTGSWFGLVSAVRDIKHHEGARGLFKGHSATLLRIFPYAAIKFLAYEQIRAVIIPSRDKETPFRRLISGSLAGVTSVFFTYPLELIRVRLAFETKRSSRSSFTDIFRQIYHERVSPPSAPNAPPAGQGPAPNITAAAEGVSSVVSKAVPSSGLANFYRGFAPTILGMLPYAGISFLTHDTVGDWLRLPAISQYTTIPGSETTNRKGSRRPQLTAAAELFSGALAGLVSQTSSYPLEVIRRRMQVGGVVGDGRRLRIVETARIIWMEKGFRGFWVGLTIGYIKVIPMAATAFFVYERLKWTLGI